MTNLNKVMIGVIDGCSAEYLTQETAPNLYRLTHQSPNFHRISKGTFPTVTNVNHARILTGKFPEENGINGNVSFNKSTGEKKFIQSDSWLTAPTIFSKLLDLGLTSALLTVKGKVDEVFGSDATWRINAESPNNELLRDISSPQPPTIENPESGPWVFEAARHLIIEKSPDFVYCTTNDYVMHHYQPHSSTAQDYIRKLDKEIGKIHDAEPDRVIYITADHGMNAKPTLINLQLLLDQQHFDTTCILPLADRYLKNHPNQECGSAYVYLYDDSQASRIQTFLEHMPGIEQVLTKPQAVEKYHLSSEKIGDLVAFAEQTVAFGLQSTVKLYDNPIRSHGSLHEQDVPLFAINPVGSFAEYGSTGNLFQLIIGRLTK